MKRLILIAFIIISHSCFAQKSSDDYILTLNFAPSFMNGCKLVIEKSTNQSSVKLNVLKDSLKDYIKDEAPIADTGLNSLNNFLKTYKFQIKSNIDTLGSHKIFENGDSVLIYKISAGLDGINVGGDFVQNDVIHKFTFWSPEYGTPNQKLMFLLFKILYSSFKSDTTINYLEQLEQYFPHQLGVKKLSDQPLKYKLYGTVTSNDSLQFDKFLSTLPYGPNVYIDMSNFSGMGTMFFPIIKKYCKNRENVFWLNPSYMGSVDLYKIGINKKYIISKREIVKIKDKGGSETIITKQDNN